MGCFRPPSATAHGYGNFATFRTVVFLLAGKLGFSNIKPLPLNPADFHKTLFFSVSLVIVPSLDCLLVVPMS